MELNHSTQLSLLLLFIHSSLLVDATVREAIAKQMTSFQDMLFTQSIAFDTTENRGTLCGRRCLNVEGCLAFTYVQPTGACRGYTAEPGVGDPKVYDFGAQTWSCESCSGWIVFQRRQDGSVNFLRPWIDYVSGFGDPSGEYWMGLEELHTMTSSGNWTLRIELEDWAGNTSHASYTGFFITNSTDNYRLMFDEGSYSGDAGDGLTKQRGSQFSTQDQDNDAGTLNCADQYRGAWWFENCFDSHLNGEYQFDGISTNFQGLMWFHWTGTTISLKSTEMKIKLL